MKRVLSDFAYSDGPRAGCFWDDTCQLPSFPKWEGDGRADVVVIGGGFTGLSCALHLAEAGVDVVLLEANQIGWGASGRNGGFCCLGGGILSDRQLDRAYGKQGRLDWRRTEVAAVRRVEDLIDRFSMDVDRHSAGETILAHAPNRAAQFETAARAVEENYGVSAEPVDSSAVFGPGFFGGLTVPIGFGLNPRKFLAGLLQASVAAGVRCFESSLVTGIDRTNVMTANGAIVADSVVVATNGYSSEDLPPSLRAGFMPVQSNVLVTRPLTDAECAAQGWQTDQMAYDTRNLLHYFRKLPDGRFLFGMRGGLRSTARSETRARQRVRADFDRMFPAWKGVEATHAWSGMACLARGGLPFVDRVSREDRVFAALCYHGNGVAMGSHCGALLSGLVMDRMPELYPAAMQRPLARFPLGMSRRLVMPLLYLGLTLGDLI